MIAVAGGTSTLGRYLIPRLLADGRRVRVLTRDPAKAATQSGVEFVACDVLDSAAVQRAVAGADTVISAMHGLTGGGRYSPRSVDGLGNHHLIEAARAQGVGHFVLLSGRGVTRDHGMELFRMKYLAEQELRASGMPFSIIQPSAFMETWLKIVGEPFVRTGTTRIFGAGQNPINFVAVDDVAAFVALAVRDASLRSATIEVIGPENLSMREFVKTITAVTGKSGSVSAVPLTALRVLSVLMRAVNATLARQMRAAVIMDTEDLAADATVNRRRFPEMPCTALSEVVRRDYFRQTS
ncbi:MAG: SDR family oxidoreductase [Gemmatimonadota bacterium]|nr:SDR family oxidoreductase [Gemmatimonadota bacterium]